MATGAGYNPYRDANGRFAKPEDVGAKVEGDLQEAYASGDMMQAEAIEEYAMNKMPDSKLGQELLEKRYGSTSSVSKESEKPTVKKAATKAPVQRRKLSEREQSLRDRNVELARRIVELRADNGDVTFDDANPERARRRLSEAIEYAEGRGNTNLVNKLTSAKVLPSGAFQRKSDKQRVNTDSALKSYVTEKEIEAGRGRIEAAIQEQVNSGKITEGKYTHKDDSGTYSLTVSSGVDKDAYEALDEETKAAISSKKPSLSIELAKSKLTGEQLEAVTSKQQVMDFVVGKKPQVEGMPEPKTSFSGSTSEEVASSGLQSLSSYTQAVNSTYGSKADRAAKKTQDAEIIKSAVADRGQNTFVPGRAYANGALLSTRTVINRKAAEEHLTPAQQRAITGYSLQPDAEKAKKVLSPEQYSAIFEKQKASFRVTPKKAK